MYSSNETMVKHISNFSSSKLGLERFFPNLQVEKVRELKMVLIGKQENHFREKQRRAEEKRKIKLKEKVRKAQEEEAKVFNIKLA